MIATRAGWLEGHEVSEVWFDPAVLPFGKLFEIATQKGCARQVWVTIDPQAEAAPAAKRLDAEPRPDKEPKYYLLQTPWRHVPMTDRQATVINALLRPGGPGVTDDTPLSPRQRALFAAVQARPDAGWPIAIDAPIEAAWARAAACARRPAATKK